MDNENVLEPDLICSKDGNVLHCSDAECVRTCEVLLDELFCCYFEFLFGRFR